MIFSRRMFVLLILLGSIVLVVACTIQQPTVTPSKSQEISSVNFATINSKNTNIPPTISTSTQLPTATSTFTLTPTATLSPTSQPIATLTTTPTLTPNLIVASLVPGVYSGGGCVDYTIVKKTSYGWPWASFTWCVEYVEIHPDGSMIFVMSWKLVDFSEGITSVSKRSDVNNSNMYLTDNLGNRYDAIIVSGDAAGDLVMEKDVTYFGTFTFRPPKPGANRFTFHDDDNSKAITDILLQEPAVYIYDIDLKWSPLSVTYYSDKWTAGQIEQGGVMLTDTKYPNCQVMEWQPGDAQGKYLNTIDIGTLKYDIYRTQEQDWSLREYVLVGGIENAKLTSNTLFHVTIPYDNSAACLEDVGAILASVRLATP